MPLIEQLQERFQINLESFNTDHLSQEQYGAFKQLVVDTLQPHLKYTPIKTYLTFFLPGSTVPNIKDKREEIPLIALLCQTAAFFDTIKIERESMKLIDLICSNVINNNSIIILEVINIIQCAFNGIIRRITELNGNESEDAKKAIQAVLSLSDNYEACSKQLAQHNVPTTLDQFIVSIYNRIILISHQLIILAHCENTSNQYLSLVENADKIKQLFFQIIHHNNDRTPLYFAPAGSLYALTSFKNILDLQEVILALFDKIIAAKVKFIKEASDDADKAKINAAFETISTLVNSIEAVELASVELDTTLDTASEPKPPPHTQLYQPTTVAGKPPIACASVSTTLSTAVTPR